MTRKEEIREAADITVNFKPEIRLIDGNFQIWINGERWSKYICPPINTVTNPILTAPESAPVEESQGELFGEVINFCLALGTPGLKLSIAKEALMAKFYLTRKERGRAE